MRNSWLLIGAQDIIKKVDMIFVRCFDMFAFYMEVFAWRTSSNHCRDPTSCARLVVRAILKVSGKCLMRNSFTVEIGFTIIVGEF